MKTHRITCDMGEDCTCGDRIRQEPIAVTAADVRWLREAGELIEAALAFVAPLAARRLPGTQGLANDLRRAIVVAAQAAHDVAEGL